jgi:hypothetical protein
LEDEPILRSVAQANGEFMPRSPMVIHHFASRTAEQFTKESRSAASRHARSPRKHRVTEGQGIGRNDYRAEHDATANAHPEQEWSGMARDDHAAAQADFSVTRSSQGSGSESI